MGYNFEQEWGDFCCLFLESIILGVRVKCELREADFFGVNGMEEAWVLGFREKNNI